MSLAPIKPKEFRVKISNCGTDRCNCSFEKMTNTNAEKLLFNATICIAKELLGKDNVMELTYLLAKDILKHCLKKEVFEMFNLKDACKDLEKEIESWDIKNLVPKEKKAWQNNPLNKKGLI